MLIKIVYSAYFETVTKQSCCKSATWVGQELAWAGAKVTARD